MKVDAAKLAGNYVDPHAGKLLVADYASQWLAGLDVRPSTAARNRSLINTHIVPRWGATPIGAVRPADVAAWRQELQVSPSTVATILTLFKSMLGDAVDHGLLPANPIEKVKLPRVEREEMRFLTPQEVQALAEAIDPRYRALVYVGAYGGLRIGELAGLQVGDLDMLRGVVSVERQVVEVAGKLTVGPLKTKAARRRVKLPRFVVEELAVHLATFASLGPHQDNPDKAAWSAEKANALGISAPLGNSPAEMTGLSQQTVSRVTQERKDALVSNGQFGQLVFPAPNGGPLSRTAFRQRFWVPAAARGQLAGTRVHDLRHTAVALWIAAGAGAKQITARAGHTSVRVTYDVYGHLFPDADDALVERLEKMHEVPVGGQVIQWPK